MRTMRKGFTLVEIMLFLAITSLLFVGIIAGTNNSIAQQRFTDSVQNFVELLRSTYSEVSNPQSVGDGRGNVAIYGKLISFGQRFGLDEELISDPYEQRIFVYDVVGNADGATSGSVTKVLADLKSNVIVVTKRDDTNDRVEEMGPAGEVKSYVLRWGASLETTAKKTESNLSGNLFTGSILIVRHPRSGTINTLYSSEIIKVNETLKEMNSTRSFDDAKSLFDEGVLNTFRTKEIDFCINPSGAEIVNNVRRDVRLVKNARNASGIELIDLDLDRIADGLQTGNRCRFGN